MAAKRGKSHKNNASMPTADTPTQNSSTSSMMHAPNMDTTDVAAIGRCSSKKLTNSRDRATRAVIVD
ncbi:hypothetical protein JY28_00985 [Neisseria meningitidis]|nr:hypothetical protein JY28_00985 [Neisseria meningitidis]